MCIHIASPPSSRTSERQSPVSRTTLLQLPIPFTRQMGLYFYTCDTSHSSFHPFRYNLMSFSPHILCILSSTPFLSLVVSLILILFSLVWTFPFFRRQFSFSCLLVAPHLFPSLSQAFLPFIRYLIRPLIYTFPLSHSPLLF